MRWTPSSLLLAAAAAGCSEGRAELDPSLVRTVGRGDLAITVRERGEIQAARATSVASELEGRATLIYLVPEGSVVATGDRVAELDVSAIEEKRAQQAIALAKAEALLEQAQKNVEIAEKEIQAAERTAETRLEIAKLQRAKFLGQARAGDEAADGAGDAPQGGTNDDMLAQLDELLASGDAEAGSTRARASLRGRLLQLLGAEENRRLEMGEMANQVLQQIDAINLARADAELAAQTLFYSRELHDKGFITTNELERDQINHQRQLSAQTLAWNNLFLLVGYSLPETQISLALEVENSELNVASVRAASEARRVREAAELRSVEAEVALAREQLENSERQIRNGVLHAPAPGLVVYAREDWDEPVYEGMEVRQGQEVVLLPDVSSMRVELRVPEAQIGRLEVGQRATIKVDAFAGETFRGHVTYVSSLPDPTPFNQSLKVYIAHVVIDGENGDSGLKPGMNGMVTVEVETLRDVLQVPLPALERRGDAHYVWTHTSEGPAAVEVEIGGHNLTDVQIVAGLEAGDRVFLVRPPGAQLPPDAEPPPIEDAPRAGEPEAASAGEPSEIGPPAASGSE